MGCPTSNYYKATVYPSIGAKKIWGYPRAGGFPGMIPTDGFSRGVEIISFGGPAKTIVH